MPGAKNVTWKFKSGTWKIILRRYKSTTQATNFREAVQESLERYPPSVGGVRNVAVRLTMKPYLPSHPNNNVVLSFRINCVSSKDVWTIEPLSV